MKWKFGIGYGINIFPKAWNGMLVMWDQYPLKKHEWNCCFFEALIFGKSETEKPRSQETKQPRNQKTKNNTRNQQPRT